MRENLYVMVRGDARVFRLIRCDDDIVHAISAARDVIAVPKYLCRVGTARNWRMSGRFHRAWREGGGESFVEVA